MICVYVLESLKDKKKYTGSTVNLERRLKEHNKGYVEATSYRRPLKLLGYQECSTIEEAARLEKKYKQSHDALLRAIKSKLFILK